MRRSPLFPSLLLLASLLVAQDNRGPTNDKAKKTYQQALESLQKHRIEEALNGFKKADKQDGGRCLPCQVRIVKCALDLRDWKAAETAASSLVGEAQTPNETAVAHIRGADG